jgi:hypothetical protein
MKLSIRAVAVCAAALMVCMIAVSGAAAKVIPSLTTTYTQDVVVPTGESGETVIVQVDDTKLGSHADFSTDLSYSYGATGMLGGSSADKEDPNTYPAPSDWRESVKDIVVDIPPGLIGNPNAIPYDERCDISTFETSICPDSATVGVFAIDLDIFSSPSSLLPLSTIGGPYGEGLTKVSLLKTDPEVPAKIGIFVRAISIFQDKRTVLSIAPLTEQGLKLRTLNVEDLPHDILRKSDSKKYELRLDHMKLTLFGKLANGRNFMTNPVSCEDWTSQLWANATYFNDNVDSHPLGDGSDGFVASQPHTVHPDCSNAGSIPFPITGNVAIDTPGRDTAPAFDFTIANPGVQGDGQVSSTPKKIVTTIPASINVDVQQLGRTCTLANFKANTCPSTSKVGSVKIQTPLISAGLTGNVYLVKRDPKAGLPDLGLYVTGAITFLQLGSNRYVGAKHDQIETTFDNIPQVGFSKLTFHLDGGPQGLLRSLSCPTYNKAPALPNFTYNFYAYSGAYRQSTTPLNLANCFGIQTLKKYPRCLYKKLPIHPNYQSRVRVKSVTVKIDGKKKGATSKAPFRFDLKIEKLKLKKKARHRLDLTAKYDDGTISKKTVTFKVCK